MSGITTLLLAGALLVGATPGDGPSITAVSPDPLPLGLTAEVDGSGFVDGQTTVSVAGAAQTVGFTSDSKLVFVTSLATPLGEADLVLTTPWGQDTVPVTVVPAPPKIVSVVPSPIVLGGLTTINGSDLSTVNEVKLGEVVCETTTITDPVIVFEAPLTMDLLGDQLLTVTGSAGYDVENVDVEPPTPSIDQVSPNPARQGDLVTLKGVIIPWNVSATIGGEAVPVLSAADGEVTVQVPPTLPVGAHVVIVQVGVLASQPAGPLLVEPADPHRPKVKAVYPGEVVVDGTIWVVGQDLDLVTSVGGGFSLLGSNDRSLQLWTGLAPAGLHSVALSGPTGTAVVTTKVVDDKPLVVPQITQAEPDPAFHGQELTIRGSDLFEITAVVVGGVEQTISYVEADEVRAVLSSATPLGAEPLFVAGGSGSNGWMVTVLEPLPEPDITPTPDLGPSPDAGPVADSGGGTEVSADASTPPPVDLGEGSDPSVADAGGTGGDSDGGCHSAPEGRSAPLLLVSLLGLLFVGRLRPRETGSTRRTHGAAPRRAAHQEDRQRQQARRRAVILVEPPNPLPRASDALANPLFVTTRVLRS